MTRKKIIDGMMCEQAEREAELDALRASLASTKKHLEQALDEVRHYSAEAERDAKRLCDVAEVLAEFGLAANDDLPEHLLQNINDEDDLRDFAEALLDALQHPDAKGGER